ncbi:hypothetical protein BV22DRAFT_976567, partial [Leucogyrophana mollusca]
SSWAARNPGRPVLPPRPAQRRQLTKAQKHSRAIATQQKKENQARMQEALTKLLEEQAAQRAALATVHNVTVDKVAKLSGYKAHYTNSRKPQLRNALVHAKMKELNEDRAPGKKYTLKEIQAEVEQDSSMKDLTEEEKEKYINDLVEFRQLKQSGARANNAAAARDVMKTTDKIIAELDNLRDRTGVYGCVFVTRSHVNDSIAPTWYATDNSADFFEDVLKLDPHDISRQFEQWACNQNESEHANVRKQCTRMVQNGLKAITGRSVAMNYQNYDTSLVPTHKIKLIGWPPDVPFVNPSLIGTVGAIRKLRDALKSGSCRWIRLNSREVEAHRMEVEAREQAGETVGRKRKRRADAGTKRNK